jgi:hypothetical protein
MLVISVSSSSRMVESGQALASRFPKALTMSLAFHCPLVRKV